MWTSCLSLGLAALLSAPTEAGSESGGTAGDGDLCAPTAGHRAYTILVDPSGRFIHCRNGKTVDTPPVSDDRVVVQFPPVDPRQPYRFRLVDPNKQRHPRHRLFDRQIQTAQDFSDTLAAFAASPETAGEVPTPILSANVPARTPAAKDPGKEPTKEHRQIADIAIPAASLISGSDEPSALRSLSARKARYLATATPAFNESLRSLRQMLDGVKTAAQEVEIACASKEIAIPPGPLLDSVLLRCKEGGPNARLTAPLLGFEAKLEEFVKARRAARDALLALACCPQGPGEQCNVGPSLEAPLSCAPSDPADVAKTAGALQKATELGQALLDATPALQTTVRAFVGDVDYLQIALGIPATSVEGHRITLGRFPAAGLFSRPVIYQLHVSREPSALFDLGGSEESAPDSNAPAAQESNEVLIDRFEPIAHRYFDLELALVYSGGLPDHPALSGRLGDQTLVREQTQGFAGGVLASLEPIEFFHPEHPLAGLLRLPVIIIPFTLDPLTNYFLGGGVGWNDVGSISFGAHIGLTTVPANGVSYGEVFRTSPIELSHLTQSGPFSAGYFVSVSLDVLGIIHLFFEESSPAVKDVYTGAELAAH